MSTFWAQESDKLFDPPGNFRDSIDLLSEPLKGQVLDLGCNRAWLAGLSPHYFGLEPSENAVRAARLHWGARLKIDARSISSRIVEGSGEAIPFNNETFDLVFAKDVLEHSRDPSKMFAEISRVLKNDATLFLSTPDAQKWVWNDPTHWRPYPRAAHRALARSFGFEVTAEFFESVAPGTQHIARLFGGKSPFFIRWIATLGLVPRNVISVMIKKSS